MRHLKYQIRLVKKRITILIILFSLPFVLFSQNTPLVSNKSGKGAFSLTDCSIVYDEADYAVIEKTAILFAQDIEKVTGYQPVLKKDQAEGNCILIGTIGKNRLIDYLISSGKLNVSEIKGNWEQFIIKRIPNPLPGIKQLLVIAGSDRRGAAYGIFTLSEAIGVSAWEWWADVPVRKQDHFFVVSDFTSQVPSVKYRGIFINDEDWGLKPWSSVNYEKELGDIGPRTYARVCELLLRLKGNMLAPAMHTCTGAFYSHPENKIVADEYGIIISTSHCEPLLFNNAAKSEWDSHHDGEWNYAINKEKIQKKLDDRVHEASPYENIYTVGMRGLHDEGLRGNLSDNEKVALLKQVITDQREILKKNIKKPVSEIPQIFVPYKETLNLYNLGLEVPEDVILVWTDDNYGYIKRLCNQEERKRKGGSGIYYHTSYLGAPHDYLWLCTTPPVLMYEELMKAYNSGATQYWLLNVGDIKPAEMGVQTFFDLAWNVKRFNMESINSFQSQFLSDIFGIKYKNTFQEILDTYYRLAWSRKPEFMGWEREWDTKEFDKLSDTKYSFQNYNDAQQRLSDYHRISDLAYSILTELPENYRPAFFEMIAYPVLASCQMNRKFLLAQLNHELAMKDNLSSANWAAEQARTAFDSIVSLNNIYNTLLNRKWEGMMTVAPGFCSKYQEMPDLIYNEGVGKLPVDLTPLENKNVLNNCTVIDLRKYSKKVTKNKHTLRIINGIGYDWQSLQLGEANEKSVNPENLNGSRFEYEFSDINADSVNLYIYSIPFFPLYQGKSTRYGISVDKQPAIVIENKPKEYSKAWKDMVLMNGVLTKIGFSLKSKKRKHKLIFICGDPGIIIQRVIVDWGGLKDSYIGPGIFHKTSEKGLTLN